MKISEEDQIMLLSWLTVARLYVLPTKFEWENKCYFTLPLLCNVKSVFFSLLVCIKCITCLLYFVNMALLWVVVKKFLIDLINFFRSSKTQTILFYCKITRLWVVMYLKTSKYACNCALKNAKICT